MANYYNDDFEEDMVPVKGCGSSGMISADDYNRDESNKNTLGIFKSVINFANALKEINFSIAQGETLAITGDAGSGKTTLLKILNGEKTNFQGQILIHDKPIQDYERIDRVHGEGACG